MFCLQVWESADSKKTKWLSKDEIKKQLLEPIIINEAVESEELNKKVEEIQEPEETAEVIKQYEYIISQSIRDSQKHYFIFKINVFKLCEIIEDFYRIRNF